MYYYLSVGSNIDPERNLSKCLETLLIRFERAYVFPCTYTQPENITTDNVFINTLLVIESDSSAENIKDYFCSVEESLGRDRSDKDRSRKDRTCDIDIITSSGQLSLDNFRQCNERYLQEVLSDSSEKAAVALFGSNFSDRPATIYLDAAASNKLVIQYEPYPLEDGVKSGLSGQ
jgi:2-amino-4-hydroxy-6-hydroxymethyldihydropteridine diphosphokinase